MKNNIFNIQANYNFLESLTHWILQKYGSDFLYLSKVTILLPSRRSCRVIRDIFLKQSKQDSIILPNIKAIGDVDFDDLALEFLDSDNEFEDLFEGSISSLKYRCLLIDEIRKFNEKTHLFGKNLTANQIDLIANNLDNFLSEIEREELDLDNLENIDDVDLASHKQKILQFLRHFGSNWRAILAKNNIKSATKYQNEMIDILSKSLSKRKSDYPIIVAGSTGSLKATSRFLKTVLKQENTFVFLQNLDKKIDQNIFDKLEDNHPQFLLKNLLQTLQIKREEVINLEFEEFRQSDDNLQKLLSYSFLPAQNTDIWTKIEDLNKDSVKNLNLIETKNNFDEAVIISLIMMQTLQDKEKNAALITSDKNLAISVKEILLTFDVNIDNSKNNKLHESDIANYLFLIALLFTGDFRVSDFLTILKHNITKAGFDREFYEKNLKLFELEILRKNYSLKSLKLIEKKVKEYGDEDLNIWFTKFRDILAIFADAKNKENFVDLIEKNLNCAKELSKNENGQIALNELNGLEEFLDFYEDLKLKAANFKVEFAVYAKLLKQFLSSYNFEIKQNHHPRLHILSPIEARLLNFDVMIVSNLNEGDFISLTNSSNWLSKNMRLDFGLPDFNRKTGISAFDFSNYLANKKVYLTRSLTSNNAPTSKLRFLMKLETVLKATDLINDFNDGKYWHFLLDKFSNVKKVKESIKSVYISKEQDVIPNPTFNGALDLLDGSDLKDDKDNVLLKVGFGMIKNISVTDVSKWMRDPYYIYAKRILKLKALNKIDEEASFANFGNFVHETLENFVRDYDKINEVKRLDELLNNYGKSYFTKYFPNQDANLLWWPRFENIANWFIKNEEKIRKNLKMVITELALETNIEGVKVTTKIDRINIDLDDNIEVIDYKTGLVASDKDVKQGLEPQLPIEALIFLNNKNLDLEKIKDLQYYSLKGRDKNEIKNLKNSKELIISAKEGIKELVKIFNSALTPFYAAPNADIYKDNEYKHLARVS